MSKLKKLIILFIILIIAFGAVSFYSLKMIYTGDKKLGEEKLFVIKEGESANEISRDLFANNLIKNKFIFETYLWVSKLENNLKAGEYRLNSGTSLQRLTNILVNGQITNERTIKIIEGWTISDIADYLDKENIIKKNDFLTEVKNIKKWQPCASCVGGNIDEARWSFLSGLKEANSLEGFLFPDTYRIYRDATAADIIQKMLDNFDQKLTPAMREDIKNSKRTILDTITMASILEKEVALKNERAMVADIFYRRLLVGMPLQADSTINYITNGNSPSVSHDDTKIDSLYNTYKYRGLSPGPISNPGLDAIDAAIHPVKNNYWFFLTTPDGQTIFSKTLEEHNVAKAKYLK
jgi:UPF0755 protein